MPALKDTVRLLVEGAPLPYMCMSFQDGSEPRGRAARGMHRVRALIAGRRGERATRCAIEGRGEGKR